MKRLPLDLPPIVSVELIQIADKTSLEEINKEYKMLKNAQNSNMEITEKIE